MAVHGVHPTFDEAQQASSSSTFSISAASIDTGTADRDTHLRSDDFFAVEKLPAITFVSSKASKKSDQLFDVEGDLGTAVDPWGHTRAGFETGIAIDRQGLRLNWNAALEAGGFLIGDEVKISVSLQAVGP